MISTELFILIIWIIPLHVKLYNLYTRTISLWRNRNKCTISIMYENFIIGINIFTRLRSVQSETLLEIRAHRSNWEMYAPYDEAKGCHHLKKKRKNDDMKRKSVSFIVCECGKFIVSKGSNPRIKMIRL